MKLLLEISFKTKIDFSFLRKDLKYTHKYIYIYRIPQSQVSGRARVRRKCTQIPHRHGKDALGKGNSLLSDRSNRTLGLRGTLARDAAQT